LGVALGLKRSGKDKLRKEEQAYFKGKNSVKKDHVWETSGNHRCVKETAFKEKIGGPGLRYRVG